MPEHVAQMVSPQKTARRMERIGATKAALSTFSDISSPFLCMWLDGQRGLSYKSQLAVVTALEFFEWLPVPFDFTDAVGLKVWWEKFLKLRCEKMVIRTGAEMAAER